MLSQLNFLRELTLPSICLRFLLAIAAGLIIGAERRNKNHAAGLRTHILVTVGSALLMITSQFASEYFGTGDIMRIGAQAVSGIGFLGAGTIMISKGKIKGLTTAAGLWATTCIGLAIGIGFYEGALLGLFTVFCTLVFLRRISHLNRNPHVFTAEYTVYLEGTENLERFSHVIKTTPISATKLEIKPCGTDSFTIEVAFNANSEADTALFHEKAAEIDGLLMFEIHSDGQAAIIGD